MTDVVDADELLRRIRVARDWAAEREAAAGERAGDDGGSGTDGGVRAADVDRAAFSAVRAALDEIIDPGSHRRQP
ncbi:hypothetical protein F0L17_24835 [Streptomyces sp. TRM43335]|uniref:Uncharacterized protein n=1 Tax=Streptomyces taklimakanensis TaxID=2569853 RepID=A0A6G2BJL8_9ACTN|nr:hypothetical protein [Streptomyces taklimakanensis]MTE22269.1 hypothetical protein [Streptomyces taklimakanensis]